MTFTFERKEDVICTRESELHKAKCPLQKIALACLLPGTALHTVGGYLGRGEFLRKVNLNSGLFHTLALFLQGSLPVFTVDSVNATHTPRPLLLEYMPTGFQLPMYSFLCPKAFSGLHCRIKAQGTYIL